MKENGERWSKEWGRKRQEMKENWKENADKMRDEWKDNQNKWRDMREGQLRSRELWTTHANRIVNYWKKKTFEKVNWTMSFNIENILTPGRTNLARNWACQGTGQYERSGKDQLTKSISYQRGKFNFKISARELRVNGKKQSDEVFNRYKKMIKDRTGMDVKVVRSWSWKELISCMQY